MSALKAALAKVLTNVTKDFVHAKRRAASRASDYLTDEQIERLRNKEDKNEIKPAAYAAMEEAYSWHLPTEHCPPMHARSCIKPGPEC